MSPASPAGCLRTPSGPRRWPSPPCRVRPCGTRGSSRGGGCGRPVFLARQPDEPLEADLARWYRRLVATVASHRVRQGRWRLLEATGWPDNQSCRNLIAWSWGGDDGGDRHVIVVNLSADPAQGRIPLGWTDLPSRSWHLTDLLEERVFDRDGVELADPGLFVALEPWHFHLLAVS